MPEEASQLDFSAEIQNLNQMQNLFLFQIEDIRIPVTDNDVRELQDAETPKTFLKSLRRLLTRTRGEPWDGVDEKATKTDRRRPRDLLITNFPIPGNFYGWEFKRS